MGAFRRRVRSRRASGGGGGDTTAPTLSSATVASDGLSIDLVYDETLDAGSVPATGDYTINGTNATLDSVGISGDTVTLTFDGALLPITGIQTVTVDYTKGTNPVQDAAGNEAANLSGQATTNNSTVDAPDGIAEVEEWWTTAAGLTSSGGTVDSWVGRKRSLEFLPGGGAPTLTTGWRNGYDAITGGSGTDMAWADGTLGESQPHGWYVGGQWAATSTHGYIVGAVNTQGLARELSSEPGAYSGVNVSTGTTVAANTPYVGEWEFNGASSLIRVEPDGAAVNSATVDPSTNNMTNGIEILGDGTGGNTSDGKIAILCWTNALLSTQDSDDLRAWLRQEMNVTTL